MGDKVYSGSKVRRYLGRRGSSRHPAKTNERFDCQAYRERNVVGRLIDRLKQHRRVASRHEKRAAYYPAMLTLDCILLWH